MIPNVLILQFLRLNCSPLLLVFPLNHHRHYSTSQRHILDKNSLKPCCHLHRQLSRQGRILKPLNLFLILSVS
ncbi:unknown [Salmonella phage FelixO1]|uniref:Uncharacterized protein n=1 Tax=Salmonella phage Felix O1 (isolate Felix O1-VT1) TaxID=1283336 RepID=Q6KGS0_BPFO1|nr:unknown [Salmonella phage FelixO1]